MTNKKQIMKIIFRVVCLMTLLLNHAGSFAQVYGQNGMVVSSNVLASQVGVDILKKVVMLLMPASPRLSH